MNNPKPSDKLMSRTDLVLESTLALLLAAIATILIAEVVFRYFLNHSLFWVEELSRFLFLWLIFLGIGMAFRRSMHFAMRTLVDSLEQRWRRVAGLLVCVAIFLTASLLIFSGSELAWFAKQQTSSGLGVSRFWFYLAIPLGGLVTMISLPALVRQAWAAELVVISQIQDVAE